MRADLELARLVVQDGYDVATGLGVGTCAQVVTTAPWSGDLYTSQIAAPLPQSVWLALLTGTANTFDAAEHLQTALLHTASTLTVDRTTDLSPSRA